MNSRTRLPIAIVTVFWAYVTVSDVLNANSKQALLTAMHESSVFAPWGALVLAHVFLYPMLLCCVGVSGCIGWRPSGRCIAIQGVLGVVFAGLAIPCLVLSDVVAGDLGAAPHVMVASVTQASSLEASVWFSSVTTFLLDYAFAVALVSGFELYRTLRDEEAHSSALEQALSTARLASLRMQLSPHSLFNLLHTIHGQIEWDPPAARALVVRFGDFLRRLLHAGEREYWRLAEEIQLAQLYLGLQQKRFADRLDFSVPEPAALPRAWVPSLILQPLVENAVVHGLAGHHGPVAVRLEVMTSREGLTLRVMNDMAEKDLAQSARRRADGIGLSNVRDRLEIQFGEGATVHAEPRNAREWAAEIHLPLLLDVEQGCSIGRPAHA